MHLHLLVDVRAVRIRFVRLLQDDGVTVARRHQRRPDLRRCNGYADGEYDNQLQTQFKQATHNSQFQTRQIGLRVSE